MTGIDPATWAAFCAVPSEEHFTPFYEQSKGLVWTLCWRILRDEDEAQDAFQGVYARLLVHARQTGAAAIHDSSQALGRLIYQAAIREANRLRLRRRRRSRREVVMDALTPLPAGDPSAREAAAQAQARARIEALVAALPEKYGLPLELHYFHGMTQSEIAALMGRSQGTISQRIARGLRLLEPLAERAGLGRAAALLGAVAAGASLCPPPAAQAAAIVFSNARALIAAGGWAAGGAGGVAVLKAILEALLVKAKVVSLAVLALSVLATAIAFGPGIYARIGDRIGGQGSPAADRDRAVPTASIKLTPPGALTTAKSASPASGGSGVVLSAVPGAVIVGRVLAQETGRSIPGVRIKVLRNRWVDLKKYGVSDANGDYRLEWLPLGEALTIVACPKDHAWQSRLVELSASSDRVRCDFVLEPAGEVAVTVTDPAGRPIPGAYINIHGASTAFNGVDIDTDATGRALVRHLSPTRQVEIIAGKNGYVDEGLKEVRFPKGRFKTALRFILTPRGTIMGGITGRVTDPHGVPLPGITIHWGFFNNSNATRTMTDPDGRYHLATGVPANDFEPLTACGKGWATQTRRDVSPGPPAVPVTVDFTMQPGHWLAGVVVDEEGRPLRGMVVGPSYTTMDQPDLTPEQKDIKTDAQGRFRIDDLPNESWHVRVYGADYPTEDLPRVACDRELRIVLRRAGRIRGRVIDQATRRPVTDFTIQQYEDTVHSFSSPRGAFTLSGLKRDKPCEFTIMAPGYPPRLEKNVPVSAPDDGEELVVELSSGRPLHGILLDRDNGALIAGAEVLYAAIDAQVFSYFSWGDFRQSSNIKILQRLVSGTDGAFTFHVGEEQGAILILPAKHQRIMIRPLEREPYLIGDTLVVKMPRAATLTGKAFFEGESQGGAYIGLVEQNLPSGSAAPRHVDGQRTAADGTFHFEGLKACEYSMSMQRRLNMPNYQSFNRKIKLAAGEQKTLDIGGDLGDCTLSGTVLDHGRPVANVVIELVPQFEWDYTLIAGHSNDKGVYAIQGLRPGVYKAKLRQETGALKPGERPLTLEETVVVAGPMVDERIVYGLKNP